MLSSYRKKRCMFVIDMDASYRDALSFVFEETHDVYGFATLAEIAHPPCEKPDVVVVDIIPFMPKKEIFRRIQILRQSYKHIPILVTSTSGKVFQHVKQLGVHAFLEKPFDIEHFKSKVTRLGSFHRFHHAQTPEKLKAR